MDPFLTFLSRQNGEQLWAKEEQPAQEGDTFSGLQAERTGSRALLFYFTSAQSICCQVL